MKKAVLLIILSGVTAWVNGCGDLLADKNSSDACRYETTQNLDQGNYDAVLNSSCATHMQLGAAHFGMAGYDANDVINRFSEANAGTGTFQSYMETLVGSVSDTTLNELDSAETEYSLIPSDSTEYQDAQFYLSLVDIIKGLALMRLVTQDASGLFAADCDKNSNGVPDGADATACALYVSADQIASCSVGVNVDTDSYPMRIQGKSATYRGMIITVSGSGVSTGCPNANNEYKRLLYQSGSIWPAVTVTTDMCQETSPDNTRQWPCPIEQNGQPLDLVTAIDESLSGSTEALGNALPGVSGDVQQSIQNVQTNACGADATCSSTDIAAYLQTL